MENLLDADPTIVMSELNDIEARLQAMLDNPEVDGFAAEDNLEEAIDSIESAKLDLPVSDPESDY